MYSTAACCTKRNARAIHASSSFGKQRRTKKKDGGYSSHTKVTRRCDLQPEPVCAFARRLARAPGLRRKLRLQAGCRGQQARACTRTPRVLHGRRAPRVAQRSGARPRGRCVGSTVPAPSFRCTSGMSVGAIHASTQKGQKEKERRHSSLSFGPRPGQSPVRVRQRLPRAPFPRKNKRNI